MMNGYVCEYMKKIELYDFRLANRDKSNVRDEKKQKKRTTITTIVANRHISASAVGC